MIEFNYVKRETISQEEMEDAKAFFIEKLGPFKKEFGLKNGSVIVHFDEPPESTKRYSFNVGNEYSLGDFIVRWNQHIESIQ